MRWRRGSIAGAIVACVTVTAAACGSSGTPETSSAGPNPETSNAAPGTSETSPEAGTGSTSPSSPVDQTTSTPPKTQNAQILLAMPIGMNIPAFLVAQQKYYPQLGLDVKGVATDGSSVVVQELVAGQGKFGVAGPASVMAGNAKGGDLRGIAYATHGDIAQLTVPKDSPIKSLKDLKGKTIGVPAPGDGSIPIVVAAMAEVGLQKDKDYQLLQVGQGGPAVAAAFQKGAIAAYSGGLSNRPGLVINGGLSLVNILPEKYRSVPGTVFVAPEKVLNDPEQREILVKLAAGWLAGGIFTAQNPDQAREISCKAVPSQCQNEDLAKLTVKLAAETTKPIDPSQPGAIPESAIKLMQNLYGPTTGGDASKALTTKYASDVAKLTLQLTS